MTELDTRPCRAALNGLNFALAAAQTGFGPFVAVWLTRQGWDETRIGIALSVGTAAMLIAQLPAGFLIDSVRHKRFAIFGALLVMAISALMLALPATVPSIWGGQALHAVASAVLTPAIAALTLTICGRDAFEERLGVNARWSSIGNAAAGFGLGFVAYYGDESDVFLVTALLVGVAIGFLYLMPRAAMGPTEPVPRTDDGERIWPWEIFKHPTLHIFAVCVVLFHLSNAALLPLAMNALAKDTAETDFAVSATIVLPQLVMAIAAPWAGSMSQRLGRRPVLLIGFLALPARAMLFSLDPDPAWLVAFQMLDGVSATVFGLMMPLIAADLTRDTGYMNVAIGSIGLAAGVGATFSTTLAGLVADQVGINYAYYGLAIVGLMSVALVLGAMPETRPEAEAEAPLVPA